MPSEKSIYLDPTNVANAPGITASIKDALNKYN